MAWPQMCAALLKRLTTVLDRIDCPHDLCSLAKGSQQCFFRVELTILTMITLFLSCN